MMPSGGMREPGGPLIALTGATGFLGSHIADLLLEKGYRVRASVRPTSSLRWLDGKPVETRETDLTDPDDCRAFVDGASGIIHCAGVVTAPARAIYLTGNVTTTACLLEAAAARWDGADRSGTFVLVSSMAAHGPAGLERPAVESNPSRPITEYGRSKLAAEQLVGSAEWPFRTAVLRPPSLYGPRDREFLPLLKMATRGGTIRLGARMTGLSLVDGRDAAAAAVALLETPTARGIFFVDDGRTGYGWQDLAASLEKAAGRRIRTLRLPLAALKVLSFLAGASRAARSPVLNRDRIRDLDTPGWVCDGRKLAETTGFTAQRDAARGLSETLDFYRKEGWL